MTRDTQMSVRGETPRSDQRRRVVLKTTMYSIAAFLGGALLSASAIGVWSYQEESQIGVCHVCGCLNRRNVHLVYGWPVAVVPAQLESPRRLAWNLQAAESSPPCQHVWVWYRDTPGVDFLAQSVRLMNRSQLTDWMAESRQWLARLQSLTTSMNLAHDESHPSAPGLDVTSEPVRAEADDQRDEHVESGPGAGFDASEQDGW